MNAKPVAAAVLAVTLLTAVAVAAPVGTAPDGAPVGDDTPANDAPGQSADDGRADESADGDASADDEPGDARRGPPVEMPDPVPEFVTSVHETIREHLSGALDGVLGEALRDVVPGGSSNATTTP